MEIPKNIDRYFYHPICNESEIDRIFQIKNANDYLLKLRADTIVDHMRLFRVYRNYALADEKNWSLEKSFNTSHYTSFIERLDHDKKKKISSIIYGNIFSNEPNGQILKTDYNPIVTVCDSLKYFFKFMNLGLIDFGNDVPEYVAVNSIRIALRVMLQTEALDFLMDPRGIVPFDIGMEIHKTIPYQMQFIAGHEFSHYLLGHLSDTKLLNRPIFKAIFSSHEDYNSQKIFSYTQQKELEADLLSIELPNYTEQEKMLILESALVWFASLDLYEEVEHTISPPMDNLSHPPARERFENILNKVKLPTSFDSKRWNKLLKTIDHYKKYFVEDVSLNIGAYEYYGSVYLDKPNTKWRGKELIDRKDYY